MAHIITVCGKMFIGYCGVFVGKVRKQFSLNYECCVSYLQF